MSDKVTTVGNTFFPVEDITHKPKRMQGDNIPAEKRIQSDSNPYSNMIGKNSVSNPVEEVPSSITLERAINYFKFNSNTTTLQGKLFLATSKWLEELLVNRNSKITAEVNTKKEEE